MRLAMTFLTLFFSLSSADAEIPEPSKFQQALPGYSYQFPRDDFSHDEYRIEWWYYTGNLKSDNDRPFGYQLTFFRVGLDKSPPIKNPSSWKVDHIYFAHMTVSDISGKKFHFFERINRKGMKNAGAESDRLHVWNESWSLTLKEKAHHLQARENGIGLNLHLTPIKKRVLHGKKRDQQKRKWHWQRLTLFFFPTHGNHWRNLSKGRNDPCPRHQLDGPRIFQ